MNQSEIVFILGRCTQCSWERAASTPVAIQRVQKSIDRHTVKDRHEVEVQITYRQREKL